MIKRAGLMTVSLVLSIILLPTSKFDQTADAAQRRRTTSGIVCFDPTVRCVTSYKFDAHDMAFRIPKDSFIYESEQFYAVMLKSVGRPDNSGNCDNVFISEDERIETQALFPRRKVFTSRCTSEPGEIYYQDTTPGVQFMAVYGGKTKAQAEQMLNTVRATGKFSDANIRRMRVAFNGT